MNWYDATRKVEMSYDNLLDEETRARDAMEKAQRDLRAVSERRHLLMHKALEETRCAHRLACDQKMMLQDALRSACGAMEAAGLDTTAPRAALQRIHTADRVDNLSLEARIMDLERQLKIQREAVRAEQEMRAELEAMLATHRASPKVEP